MADLNNTIVRGKLRVTEDINTNGTINGNGSGLTDLNASNIGSGSLALARITAGTNGQILKMVNGAAAWSSDNGFANPMTTAGDIIIGGTSGAASRLAKGSNGTFLGINSSGNIAWVNNPNTDTQVTAVENHYSPTDGINLMVSSSGTATRGSTKVLTNVAVDAAGHITGGTWYTLPSSKYKHNIVLSGTYSNGPGGAVYCTFSFINDSATAISDLQGLENALADNFTDEVCPACGLFGHEQSGSAGLYLVTGITYTTTLDPDGVAVYVMSIASTNGSTMHITGEPSSTEATLWDYPLSSTTTINDTVEDC